VIGRTRSARRRGFTLIEMAIAIAVFSLVIGSAMTLLLDGQDATRATQQRANAARKAQTALDRAIEELREASSTVNPDPATPQGTPSLQFQQPLSVAGNAVNWSGMLQLLWESDPADALGGGDNDGDGLVDEGRLVLVRDVGALNERRIVLTGNVPLLDPDELANNADDNGNGVIDEGGFNIRRVDEVFTLRLVVSEPGPGGQRQIGRAEASIRLRN
jgi:prepilin-type N-terminal cleavage/methylation domain-containing protein